MTGASPHSATPSSHRRAFSSSVMVAPSPVLPASTSPSEPFSSRWCMRRTLASSSSAPSRSNGVTIAVRMPPMKPTSLSSVRLGAPYRARRTSGTAAANGRIPCRKMQTERDYSHRTTVEKLGVVPAQRVEIAGDVGPGLRRDVKEALGRGLVRSGELDGAIVLVESEDEAKEALVRYRARIRDTGYVWMITRKRGHEGYLDQMSLVPHAKKLGLIDNKTCSIDDERSGIRFVVPRALRGNGRKPAA